MPEAFETCIPKLCHGDPSRSSFALTLHIRTLQSRCDATLRVLSCLVLLMAVHTADTEWPINGGQHNIRYSPLTQVGKENVNRLEVAWTYNSRDAFKDSEVQSNPIVIDGVLYATTPTMRVVALPAVSGKELYLEFRSEPGPAAGPPLSTPRRAGGVQRPRVCHLQEFPVRIEQDHRAAHPVVWHRGRPDRSAAGTRPSSRRVSRSARAVRA